MTVDQITNAIQYYFKAKTIYRIQSTKAYRFIKEVFDRDSVYYAFGAVEAQRALLKTDQTLIDIKDLGAGSLVSKQAQRSVSHIAQSALSPPQLGEDLFRAALHINARTILELGTSLGVSSAYLALTDSSSCVTTIEGDPSIAAIATQVHRRLGLTNVTIINASFDVALRKILLPDTSFDLVFVDGHHTAEATLKYTDMIWPYLSTESLVIYDDINWSKDMYAGWSQLSKDHGFGLTIETFRRGYAFKTAHLAQPQHYTYIPYWLKPWQLGVFQ